MGFLPDTSWPHRPWSAFGHSREVAALVKAEVKTCARIFEICSQSYTASRGVLSAGKDQGTGRVVTTVRRLVCSDEKSRKPRAKTPRTLLHRTQADASLCLGT